MYFVRKLAFAIFLVAFALPAFLGFVASLALFAWGIGFALAEEILDFIHN